MKTHEHDISRWILPSFCGSTAQEFEHRMQMIDDAHADLQVGVSRRLFRLDPTIETPWHPMASHGGMPGEDQGSSHGEAFLGHRGKSWVTSLTSPYLCRFFSLYPHMFSHLCYLMFLFVFCRNQRNSQETFNQLRHCLPVQVGSCSPFLPPFDAPRNTRW